MDFTALNHISLCTGYGGIDLGLSRVLGDRVRTVAYSEIEAFACANLVAKMEAGLLDPAPIWTDLKTFPWEKFRGLVDILSGGYPCQPFSAAGKRAGKNDPRHLWPWIADGIAILRPRFCFFENVEGHVTLGLRDVIEDLGRMGYRTTWGVFSAAEVGAPHQRKRVFVLAHDQRKRIEELSGWFASPTQHGTVRDGGAWPSRPGEPQHGWEPPRVVGNERRELDHTSGNGHRENNAVSAGREGAVDAGFAILPDSLQLRSNGRADGAGGRVGQPGKARGDATGGRSEGDGLWEVESGVGLQFDGDPRELGEAVDESQTRSAYQVLLELWCRNESEEIQWPTGGPSAFLAEEILRSGVRWDEFPQRICFFVWALQAGHKVSSFGLPDLWLNRERSGDSSHRQEPRQQLRRELAYALCVLSYKTALARGQGPVEGEITVQSVRRSGAAAWVMSETLVSIQEVWRSELDEKTWTERAYFEASNAGHNRTDELRLLGNGVVPATAERAFRVLMAELSLP
jgi:site-specific DNA-cytosine methylase